MRDSDQRGKSDGRKRAGGSRSEDEPQPPSIDGHLLYRRIGRGSYGEVWLAKSSLGSWRAIKIIHRSSFEESKPFDRELAGIRQFEPISRSHEGFVDILHVGIDEANGSFYYIMELGDDVESGQSIDPNHYSPKTLATEIQKRKRIGVSVCLEMGLALSLSLGELHKFGLVHRDIKPANIIFVNGVPKLADIGLVATIGQAQSYVGTEGFIPPEGPGYPTSDVYSLGKVLYEASTGKDRQEFPALPDGLLGFEDRERFLELNEVLLDACHSDVKYRYSSAVEMHQRLLLVVNGKSVKRLKLLERRFSALKRATAVLAFVFLIASLLGFDFYRTRKEAANNRSRQIGENNAYGNEALQKGDFMGAIPFYASVLQLEENDATASQMERFRIGTVLSRCPKLVRLFSAHQELDAAGFNPDGTQLAVASYAGPVQIYELRSNAAPIVIGSSRWLTSICFSKDGRFVLSSSEDKTATIWDVKNNRSVAQFVHPDEVQSARFSPDSKQILTASTDGTARVWDIETREIKLALAHGKKLWFADFSLDGKFVVTCGEDGTARVWDSAGRQTAMMKHPGWVYCATFNPEGTKIVTACSDHKARVWSVAGQLINPLMEHGDIVRSAEFSPDGRMILTSSADGNVRLWDAQNQTPIRENSVLRQGERVMHATFSNDGRQIVATGNEGGIRVWDLSPESRPTRIAAMECGPNGNRRLLLHGSNWEMIDTNGACLLQVPTNAVAGSHSFSFSQNGKFLAVKHIAAHDGCHIQFYDAITGRESFPQITLTNAAELIVIDNKCQNLVASDGNFFQLFDLVRGNTIGGRRRMSGRIENVSISPTGDTSAIQCQNLVCFYSNLTGEQIGKSIPSKTPISYIEFSHSSSLVAICSADDQWTKCAAQVYEVQTGAPVGPPLLHKDGISKVRFSPDDSFVATASEDYTAMVWNYRTGEPVGRPCQHDGTVTDVSFSEDGTAVATVGLDGRARLWRAKTGDPLTPILEGGRPLQEVILNSNLTRFYTKDNSDEWREWLFQPATNSAKNLIKAAKLLNGLMPEGDGSAAESSNQSWKKLQSRFSAFQIPNQAEIEAWHKSEAEESASEGNAFAAQFHIQWLAHNRQNPTPELRF